MINGNVTQGFVYSSQTQVIEMLDAKGQIVQSFDYASKSNSPDVATIGAKVYRIVSDQVGTPRLLIDSKTGQIAEASFSDEFGADALNFGKSKIPFGFAGGIADADTKLVHFGAREYDPETGRWTSKDRTLFKGGDANLYSYVASDPINFVDASGFQGTPYDSEQDALIQILKDYARRGNMTLADAEAAEALAVECKVPGVRVDLNPVKGNMGPHLNAPIKSGHIPLEDVVIPGEDGVVPIDEVVIPMLE